MKKLVKTLSISMVIVASMGGTLQTAFAADSGVCNIVLVVWYMANGVHPNYCIYHGSK